MNCKPGDLAVVVYSTAGNEGRVVSCVKFLGAVRGWVGEDLWLIEADRPMNSKWGVPNYYARDSRLRPLRDPGDDATDETLLWKPVPSTKEPA